MHLEVRLVYPPANGATQVVVWSAATTHLPDRQWRYTSGRMERRRHPPRPPLPDSLPLTPVRRRRAAPHRGNNRRLHHISSQGDSSPAVTAGASPGKARVAAVDLLGRHSGHNGGDPLWLFLWQ
jgi:hypothetical protein